MSQNLPFSKPLYEQVIELIEERIIAGEFQPGDRLPSENELSSSYQVSRTVIREALKVLKEKGFIESYAGRGTFVVNKTNKGVKESIGYLMRRNPENGFAKLLEVRELFEPQIAFLATQRAKPKQIKEMQRAVQKMDAHINDVNAFSVADLEFHLALARATDNPLLELLFSSIVEIVRAQQEYHVSLGNEGAQRSQTSHKRILKAVEAKDAESAQRCMWEHLQQVRQDLQPGQGS